MPGSTALTREEIWFLSPRRESKASVFLCDFSCDTKQRTFKKKKDVVVIDELCLLFLAFLTTQMLGYNGNLWIGMNDINWEKHFVWTDGKAISYTNWAKGQPTSVPDGGYSFEMEVNST